MKTKEEPQPQNAEQQERTDCFLIEHSHVLTVPEPFWRALDSPVIYKPTTIPKPWKIE